MLRTAIIGNGKGINRYHIPFILKTGKFEITTVYSRSGKSKWAPVEGVHYTTDINDIWADKPDLVVISTPSDTHAAYARLVLEHGFNALVDKPFAETAEEAEELFALAKQKGLFLQCYQNRRFDSDFLTVQKVIESGRLGDLLEVEMHFDYYRPEIPENVHTYSRINSYVYGHACHTVDQVLSYFGEPEHIVYDVRQLLGEGRMNDYFDMDFFYPGPLKVSVKSSYFRLKERASFIVYGKKGVFVKQTKDRQEEHLKQFYMPDHEDFGLDLPEHYGTLTYIDDSGDVHEERVVSERGDYARFYEAVYASIAEGKEKLVKDEETIAQLRILEKACEHLK